MTMTFELQLLDRTAAFRANTNTGGSQLYPDVLGLSNGGYAVAYQTHTANFSGFIELDFYDAASNHVRHAVPHVDAEEAAFGPALTQLTNGNVLVVWADDTGGFVGGVLHGRLYTIAGVAIGGELDLAFAAGGMPSVTALPGGSFAVSSNVVASDSQEVFVDVYDAAGNLLYERQVSTNADEVDTDSSVAVLVDGGFVVAYTNSFDGFIGLPPEEDTEVRAAIYNADGSVRTADFLVESSATDTIFHSPAVVGLPGGNFAMVYVDDNRPGEGDTSGITLRIYTATGGVVNTVQVNTADTNAHEIEPDITVLDNGYILVTWSRDSDNTDIFGRLFDQAGNPLALSGSSSQFLIRDSGQIWFDTRSAVSVIDGGRFVTAWQENPFNGNGGDGDGAQITARVQEIARLGQGDGAADVFSGDELADTLLGGGGNDTLSGGDSNDALFGENDNDVLSGDAGDDLLFGGDGGDSLNGGAGADSLDGGTGDDTYVLDTLHVGSGGALTYDAVIEGDNAGIADTVHVRRVPGVGVPTGYTLTANVERGVIQGAPDFFDLTGNARDNSLTGNGGANWLNGAAGADILTGGAGHDTYVLDTVHQVIVDDLVQIVYDTVVEAADGDNDTVRVQRVSGIGNPTSYTLGANVENGVVTGTGNFNLTGNALGNILTGNAGNNTLNGLAGDDRLDGGAGADTMRGGTNNDTYFVDNAGDQVFEASGEGTDRVFAGASYTLAAGQSIETLSTTSDIGTTAIDLTGNEIVNVLIGNDGVNRLDGRGEADVMAGYGGDDWYFVDVAGDKVVFEGASDGNDRVFAGVSFTLAATQRIETLSTLSDVGTTAIDLTGNEFVNVLIGNDGANRLDGRGAADVMAGYGGDDWYFVDNVGDKVVLEGASDGNDRVFASASYTLAATQSIETLSTLSDVGTGAINLTGNEFVNVLIGNDGVNRLDGRGGADVMAGYGGNDWYFVDVAGDKVVFEGANDGIDRVFAGVSYTLAATQRIETLSTLSDASTTAINLTGNEFANTLIANAGANVLNGGAGADVLASYGGNDIFLFNTAIGPSNIDTLYDFVVANDTVHLENAIFTQLTTPSGNTLSAGQFFTGAAAHDADDRIIYNSATGALFYDSDGDGATAAIQFAKAGTGLGLTNGDFFVV